MRIECGSVEGFCAELTNEASDGRVWQSTIRLRIDRNPEQREAVSHNVVFHASALIGEPGADPSMLLHYDGLAGYDNSRGNQGSQIASDWWRKIEDVCDTNNLKIRHGKFELV